MLAGLPALLLLASRPAPAGGAGPGGAGAARPAPARAAAPVGGAADVAAPGTATVVEAPGPGGPEDFRIGLTFGGISLVGLVFEYRWGDRAVDLNVGTWSFRDLSVSITAKEYLGPGSLRPFFGLGLWAVAAPAPATGRTGLALVLHAPVGADWNVDGDHHVGAALNINRAFYVRRRDPRDDTPPNPRFVPLPAFYYRWRR